MPSLTPFSSAIVVERANVSSDSDDVGDVVSAAFTASLKLLLFEITDIYKRTWSARALPHVTSVRSSVQLPEDIRVTSLPYLLAKGRYSRRARLTTAMRILGICCSCLRRSSISFYFPLHRLGQKLEFTAGMATVNGEEKKEEEASTSNALSVITEGSAKLTFTGPTNAFYNHVQEFNRDLT